jgi:hypothetical protein
MDNEPSLFISHKHADKQIAKVLADFIGERGVGKIKVHLSSSPHFQGPIFGPSLNAQLRQALWKTEALILVYTSEEQDWSYCMWECGMAMHPESPNTNLIVIQCGNDVPAPFKDVLRVNPRNKDDIKRFVKQLLCQEGLFKHGSILPELDVNYLDNYVTDLHRRLEDVLPKLDDGQVEEWPAWPSLCVELPSIQTDKFVEATENENVDLSRRIVSDHAQVIRYDSRAAQLFGRSSLPGRLRFVDLVSAWKTKYPDGDTRWFESCAQQMMVCARRGFPVISPATMHEVGGDASFTPVVTRVQRLPFSGTVQFEIFFFDFSDPRALLVSSRMLPISDVFFKKTSSIDAKALLLIDLLGELRTAGRNRVPILGPQGEPLYIIHRSLITDFLAEHIIGDSGRRIDPYGLTLADMLDSQSVKTWAESSYAVVSMQATLADAKSAMLRIDGCSDVFITATGKKGEPVLGLLTNNRIARNV